MSPPTSTSQKHLRVLACVLCQHRKIKCDRNTPCSNCIKANVTCTPSTPAPARKRRRPNQDLQERLARCEDLLKRYAGAGPPPPPQTPLPAISSSHAKIGGVAQPAQPAPALQTASTGQQAQISTPNSPGMADSPVDYPSTFNGSFADDASSTRKMQGRIVKDDAGSRFMDSYVWTSVMDQLQAMKEIIETEEPDEISTVESEKHTPETHSDLIIQCVDCSRDLHELQPDPVHAFRLWQIFLDRVNPLVKVVHIPTLQPYVMEGAVSIGNVPLKYQALLFAVYMMSTLALSEEEAPQMLGMSQEAAIQRYTAGVKIALQKFDFLKNYDMAVMQALVLYLCALQGRYDRHATWIMSGTILRIAQKMGYHRDGELLNLPPFETEMRRRVWWQLVLLDGKYAVMSGLSHSLLPVNWDTREPQNVNDADLFPGLTEPVQARDGPTEMAFSLVMFQVGRFLLETASRSGFEAAMMGHTTDEMNPEEKEAERAKYRGLIRQLEDNLKEIENRYVDASAGNVHAAALVIRPMIASKMAEMLVPTTDPNSTQQQRLLRLLVMHLEHNADAYENFGGKGFIWYVKPHFQVEAFTVVVGLLAELPQDPVANQAWKGVEIFFHYHPELYDTSQKKMHANAVFVLKAWRAREQVLAQSGQAFPVPNFITRLRALLPSYGSRATSQSSVTPPSVQQPRPQITELDSFLGGYLDMSSFQWDHMWNPVPSAISSDPMGQAGFGDLNLGMMGDMKMGDRMDHY